MQNQNYLPPQAAIEEVRQCGAESLARTQCDLGEQLRQLRETCSALESANGRVSEELTVSRRQEASLKARLAEIGESAVGTCMLSI